MKKPFERCIFKWIGPNLSIASYWWVFSIKGSLIMMARVARLWGLRIYLLAVLFPFLGSSHWSLDICVRIYKHVIWVSEHQDSRHESPFVLLLHLENGQITRTLLPPTPSCGINSNTGFSDLNWPNSLRSPFSYFSFFYPAAKRLSPLVLKGKRTAKLFSNRNWFFADLVLGRLAEHSEANYFQTF